MKVQKFSKIQIGFEKRRKEQMEAQAEGGKGRKRPLEGEKTEDETNKKKMEKEDEEEEEEGREDHNPLLHLRFSVDPSALDDAPRVKVKYSFLHLYIFYFLRFYYNQFLNLFFVDLKRK